MPAESCFKAYDIRGKLGETLDAEVAYRIGRGFARALGLTSVVVGRDSRHSSIDLQDAAMRGLVDEGVRVVDLGLCGTEEMYFATSHLGTDGGLEVTASHNPIEYNGMKMVRAESRPITRETGLDAIEALVLADDFGPLKAGGSVVAQNPRDAYVARVLSFIRPDDLRPLKVVVNAGNGAAGPTFDAIAEKLGHGIEFVRVHHAPDGSFPNGIPNPLLVENRSATADRVRAVGADLGVAWDGDFDRCFLFDAQGNFVDGEYVVGLLAAGFLTRDANQTIIHDPRVAWNTRDIVQRHGGRIEVSRTGHAFFKEKMRETNAIYGGEMSAHHYFREFMYCDSGMIPWVMTLALIGRTGRSLADLVEDMRASFPSSGEINFTVADPAKALRDAEARFETGALHVDHMDGLSMEFEAWRFNLRASNTEPVTRLNIETRDDTDLLAQKVAELSGFLANR